MNLKRKLEAGLKKYAIAAFVCTLAIGWVIGYLQVVRHRSLEHRLNMQTQRYKELSMQQLSLQIKTLNPQR